MTGIRNIFNFFFIGETFESNISQKQKFYFLKTSYSWMNVFLFFKFFLRYFYVKYTHVRKKSTMDDDSQRISPQNNLRGDFRGFQKKLSNAEI